MREIVALLTTLIFASGLFAQASQSDFSLAEPTENLVLRKIDLWSTQYYIHQFTSSGTIPIVYQDGKASGLFADTCDFCKSSLEGTAFVTDSLGEITIINFAKTGSSTFVDCRQCKSYSKSSLAVENWGKTLWTKSSGYGDGVKNYKLIPYRTIAVDNSIIPYGSVIYIPQAKGKIIQLPNGVTVEHDGYFFAGDTGGAIKGNHIDVFTGVFSGNPFPDVIKSNSESKFEAFLVTDIEIINTLKTIQTK